MSEAAELASSKSGEKIQVVKLGTTQTTTVTIGEKVIANPIDSNVVRIVTDVSILFAFAVDPTGLATAGAYLPANSSEYFRNVSGEKIAFLTADGATAGNIWVTEAI